METCIREKCREVGSGGAQRTRSTTEEVAREGTAQSVEIRVVAVCVDMSVVGGGGRRDGTGRKEESF